MKVNRQAMGKERTAAKRKVILLKFWQMVVVWRCFHEIVFPWPVYPFLFGVWCNSWAHGNSYCDFWETRSIISLVSFMSTVTYCRVLSILKQPCDNNEHIINHVINQGLKWKPRGDMRQKAKWQRGEAATLHKDTKTQIRLSYVFFSDQPNW